MTKESGTDSFDDRKVEISYSELEEIEQLEPDLTVTRNVKPNDVDGNVSDDLSTVVDDSSTALDEGPEHSHEPETEELEPQSTDDEDIDENDEEYISQDYFSDDEAFLAGDDKVVHTDTDLSLFKQNDGVVSWEIVNFYKDNGRPRSKFSLRNDPPLMIISSSSGVSAEFILTHNFAKSMAKSLEDVNRGYYGMGPASEKKDSSSFQTKIADVKEWILENKVKSAATAIVLGFMVVASFLL